VKDEAGIIKFSITPLNFDGVIDVLCDLDADIKNQYANYDEKFWNEIEKGNDIYPYVISETKKTRFRVCTAMHLELLKTGATISADTAERIEREKYIGSRFRIPLKKEETLLIYKYAAITSSLYFDNDQLYKEAEVVLEYLKTKGYKVLLKEHENAWKKNWDESDIIIKGDVAAQQGIRFNIFQLNQTYTGKDSRLNIGPKGFTGEKYGGSTYWDTEAYLLPFYLSTAEEKVAEQLLVYRYNQLQKAIENGIKLGFKDGAALFPMVTMNGEECHNEWEITFEEIHRNGAIAFAIYEFVRYTGKKDYLARYGLEVLIAISRFWEQRVNFSEAKQKFVMLGVTGPNEYENNVNNNWYTLKMAEWTMYYTLESLSYVKEKHYKEYSAIIDRTRFNESEEPVRWKRILENLYFPFDSQRNVFLQQDGFLDKDLRPASSIPEKERPIHQHWSWDRILRSCFIKQADVLQGMYFLEDQFDRETIKRHFDFYEPMTVHESSLSSCVHSILASKIGDHEKAYKFYLNAARLDLDDYNNDTEDGLHITSMGGTWMTIVKGFGGMQIKNNRLNFSPFLPKQWESYSFKIEYRGSLLNIVVTNEMVTIENESEMSVELTLYDKILRIENGSPVRLNIEKNHFALNQ
jgi:maltose phosphorylase